MDWTLTGTTTPGQSYLVYLLQWGMVLSLSKECSWHILCSPNKVCWCFRDIKNLSLSLSLYIYIYIYIYIHMQVIESIVSWHIHTIEICKYIRVHFAQILEKYKCTHTHTCTLFLSQWNCSTIFAEPFVMDVILVSYIKSIINWRPKVCQSL